MNVAPLPIPKPAPALCLGRLEADEISRSCQAQIDALALLAGACDLRNGPLDGADLNALLAPIAEQLRFLTAMLELDLASAELRFVPVEASG